MRDQSVLRSNSLDLLLSKGQTRVYQRTRLGLRTLRLVKMTECFCCGGL